MNEQLNEHLPLNRVTKTFEYTPVDVEAVSHSHLLCSRKSSQISNRKRSELTRVPSLQAVTRTAPNARFLDSIQTIFRWKGSIYKLVWRHFVVYYALYVSLSAIYEFLLYETGRRHFEALTRYFSKSASTLNLMIMLGFFTSTTLQRLFTMQTAVAGTAKITSSFIMALKPDLPEGSVVVYLYARWAVLSWILAFRSVSATLRDKYPDMISLQRKGILLPNERLILERAETEGDLTPRPLIVIDWMLLLLKECATNGRYSNKSSHHKSVEMLMAFKKSCGNMIKFATRNMPHAVIQAVMIAVYYFGLITMLSRDLSSPLSIPHQHNESQSDVIQEPLDSVHKYRGDGRPDHDEIVRNIILYFPVMPLIQFFIFFAWLTFGRMAVNPFGEDETDIDLELLLDSHIDDYLRLGKLYTIKLEDLFPDLPQTRISDAAPLPKDNDASKSKSSNFLDAGAVPVIQPKSPFNKIVSSPEIGLASVPESTTKNNRKLRRMASLVDDKDTTVITIDGANQTNFYNAPDELL